MFLTCITILSDLTKLKKLCTFNHNLQLRISIKPIHYAINFILYVLTRTPKVSDSVLLNHYHLNNRTQPFVRLLFLKYEDV